MEKALVMQLDGERPFEGYPAGPAHFSILGRCLCRSTTQLVFWGRPHHFGIMFSGEDVLSEYVGRPTPIVIIDAQPDISPHSHTSVTSL